MSYGFQGFENLFMTFALIILNIYQGDYGQMINYLQFMSRFIEILSPHTLSFDAEHV